MYYLVYQTTNILNGMIYIGVHATNKLDDAYLGSGHRLKYAIKKYGKDNFKREILFECSNKNDMMIKEKEIVNEEFLKRSDVYNLNVGGVWSDKPQETRNKISHGNKGKPKSKEHIENVSKAKKGKKRTTPITEEEREKRRLSQLGKKASPETREKQRLAKLGKKRKPHSLETRMKMAEKANNMSEEHREKIRIGKLGKTRENDVKRTFKEKQPMSTEQRQKLSLANIGKKMSQETIAKRSLSLKTNKINKLLKKMEEWAI